MHNEEHTRLDLVFVIFDSTPKLKTIFLCASQDQWFFF